MNRISISQSTEKLHAIPARTHLYTILPIRPFVKQIVRYEILMIVRF